jgi:hypothetical protein
MMKIHAAQRDAFRVRADETFPERVRALLASRLPEQRAALAGPEGLAAVEAEIARARARGFEGERDACLFVTLAFVLGRDFDAAPWATDLLADPRFPSPTARIDALWATAKDRELDEGAAGTAKALAG